MAIEQRQGLVQKQTLTRDEINAIRELAWRCEQAEQLHMRIDWSMLSNRSGNTTNDFFYYENNRLVGYLALNDSSGAENEIMGMVHPAYRRHSIFSLLISAAFAECRTRGLWHMILVCERRAVSGQAFVRALDATYSESEHEMWLTEVKERGPIDDRLTVRPARRSEIDALVLVQSESFGQLEERTRRRIEARMDDPERSTYYIGVFGEPEVGCEEPVGALRIDIIEDIVGIYAFGIRPEYWGRGYGRQMLEEVIQLLHEQGYQKIMLDVDVENTRAVHLYTSCGFTVRTTYDYYIIAA